MNIPERRHLERMTPDRPLYIDLKPDNGGIVLNVSDGGLCFQSVAPVQQRQSVALSFVENNLARDAVGEVVWTDKTRKFGGLRFTRITPEARSEIEQLLKEVAEQMDEDTFATAAVSTEDDTPETALVPLSTRAPSPASPVHTALLRETYSLPPAAVSEKTDLVPAALPPMAVRPQRAWLPRVLLAAVVIYAVAVSIALYRYSRSAPAAHSTAAPAVSTMAAPEARAVSSVAPIVAAKPTAVVAHHRAVRERAVIHYSRTAPAPDTQPRPVIEEAPVRFDYPIVSSAAPSGTVKLQVLVNAAGRVEGIKVVAGDRTLARASVRAVRHWRYRPLEVSGQPVSSEAHVQLRFAGDEAVSIRFRD